MASTLTRAELLAARGAIEPVDPSGARIPTSAQLVTRAGVLGREVVGLRPALAQLDALTPEQRVGVLRGLERLSEAVDQVAAAAGLTRTGRP